MECIISKKIEGENMKKLVGNFIKYETNVYLYT